jgi:hypothetical protein
MENLLTFLSYALMALLVFGAVSAVWWSIRERVWPALWGVLLVSTLIAGATVSTIVDAEQPTITIKKADWTCTQAVKRSSTTYVQTGQVMNPITTTYDDCVQYTRIAK